MATALSTLSLCFVCLRWLLCGAAKCCVFFFCVGSLCCLAALALLRRRFASLPPPWHACRGRVAKGPSCCWPSSAEGGWHVWCGSGWAERRAERRADGAGWVYFIVPCRAYRPHPTRTADCAPGRAERPRSGPDSRRHGLGSPGAMAIRARRRYCRQHPWPRVAVLAPLYSVSVYCCPNGPLCLRQCAFATVWTCAARSWVDGCWP